MKKIFNQSLGVALLVFACAIWNFGQTAQPTATPPVAEDTDVVKISTSLIQLDVVVTDKNGNLITDLKPEDFEITENGERQAISGLTYFSGQRTATGTLNANMTGGMPTVGEVRRTVAIVVDDAQMSLPSLNFIKKELAKFVSEQLQPNDLVAIIKTSRGVGVLQQFTTDKKKLLATIEDLRYQPLTSSGLSPLGSMGISFSDQVAANSAGGDLSREAKGISEQKSNLESLAEINKNIAITTGSLGVLNTTIAAMSGLPGRKSILYASDGISSLFASDVDFAANKDRSDQRSTANLLFADTDKLREKLRGITETANRATIAIYTLDARGTLPINVSAETHIEGGLSDRGSVNNSSLNVASNSVRASQQGLKFLSEETSGKTFINTNDLAKSFRETLDSQNGYYILAYQPNAETFDAEKRRFNKLVVKVKRPNVNVSYRSGFFNIADDGDAAKKADSPDTAFARKIFSPYKATDVNLQVTSVYTPDEKTSTVRAFVSIDAKDLQFVQAGDAKTARFDIIAVAFNESGIPIASVGKVFEVKASPKRYEELLREGINYNLTFTTKERGGAQQIKVSIRDQNTQKVGTAQQTIAVPNFDKDDALGLSGILLQNFTMQEWQAMQSGKAPADATARMQSNTARRQFKKGTVLSFNYAVYAAPSLRTKSQAQFAVFKDGKELFKGTAEELNIASTGKLQRLNKSGAFLLGTDMAAGKYVLQVTIAGDAVKEPQTQQIDFELTN